MTPRTFRFGQRGTAPEGEAPDQLVLTPQDEENIHAYVAKIHDTIDVLNREVQAIKAGNLDVVSAIFEEKSRALKWLELQTPLVEPGEAQFGVVAGGRRRPHHSARGQKNQ